MPFIDDDDRRPSFTGNPSGPIGKGPLVRPPGATAAKPMEPRKPYLILERWPYLDTEGTSTGDKVVAMPGEVHELTAHQHRNALSLGKVGPDPVEPEGAPPAEVNAEDLPGPSVAIEGDPIHPPLSATAAPVAEKLVEVIESPDPKPKPARRRAAKRKPPRRKGR